MFFCYKRCMKKIGIIHHGCAKNLIDTELMAGNLMENGFEVSLDVYNKDVEFVLSLNN